MSANDPASPDTKIVLPKVAAKIVKITPHDAKEKLARIKSNRAINPKRVNGFVRLQKNGDFKNFGVFFENGDGDPYDGQHRFSAQQLTGETYYYVCVSGIDAETLNELIDSDKPRTVADRLKDAGWVQANHLEAALNYIVHAEQGNPFSASERLFIGEIQDFLENTKAGTELIENHPLYISAQAWGSGRNRGLPVAFMIAFEYLLAKSDPEKAQSFMTELTESIQEENTPVRAIQDAIERITLEQERKRQKGEIAEPQLRVKQKIWNTIVVGWNAYKAGKPLSKIAPANKIQAIN